MFHRVLVAWGSTEVMSFAGSAAAENIAIEGLSVCCTITLYVVWVGMVCDEGHRLSLSSYVR